MLSCRHLTLVCSLAILVGTSDSMLAQQPPADADSIVQDSIGRVMDEYLTRRARMDFTGAALVARNGRILLAKGYGLADRARRIPVTARTSFPIGSITKQFTAAAIMALEMDGKLRVEDSIGRYVPNLPEEKRRITLHQLLTHTAGLPAAYGSDFEAFSRDQLFERFRTSKLEQPPGSGYLYSNVGYSLLAAVVEVVSGKPYDVYMRERLFAPARLTSTGYRVNVPPTRRAHGYAADGKDWGTIEGRQPTSDGPTWHLRGNGGVLSTVYDMYRWHQTLERDDVLSAGSRKKMFTRHVPEGPNAPTFYGYGWSIQTTPRNTTLIAHNGGNPVFSADFLRYVDEGVVIYVTSSVANTRAYDVSGILARIVFGRPYAMPPAVVEVDSAGLSRVAGAYRFEGGERLTVISDGRRLRVETEGQRGFAALGGGAPIDSAVAAAQLRRASDVITASREGRYEQVASAFGSQMSVERVKDAESGMWRQREMRYGAYRGFKVMGTAASEEGNLVTTVRLEFERGSPFTIFTWNSSGERLIGVEGRPPGQGTWFYPVARDEFAPFGGSTPSATRLRFETRSGASRVVVVSPSGELVALRGQ